MIEFSSRCFCFMQGEGIFWFRIFGYGLHFRKAKGYVPLFSERYGYRKFWYVFGLRIGILKRSDLID